MDAQAPLSELTIYYDMHNARYLLQWIRRVAYGDALLQFKGNTYTGWRLEYICPDIGHVHYLLYKGDNPVGLQYVRAPHWTSEVQRRLAAYLTVVGFTPTNVEIRLGGAQTPIKFVHNRLPHLFEFAPDEDKDTEE